MLMNSRQGLIQKHQSPGSVVIPSPVWRLEGGITMAFYGARRIVILGPVFTILLAFRFSSIFTTSDLL